MPVICQFIPVRTLQRRRDLQNGFTLKERKNHQRKRRLLIQMEKKEKVTSSIFISLSGQPRISAATSPSPPQNEVQQTVPSLPLVMMSVII